MKKSALFLALAIGLPIQGMAQTDDLYFVPKKQVESSRPKVLQERDDAPAYYVGSHRSVDEYNRRGKFRSSYKTVGKDSLGNDIIQFEPGTGLYPDSVYSAQQGRFDRGRNYGWDDDDDYRYSRRMSRFDDYWGFYDPWYVGRWGYPYWRSRWYGGWYDPWYYSSYYGWYDPRYSSYYGWYDPWYYGGYYGWGYPYYYGYYPYRGYVSYGVNTPDGVTGYRTWGGSRTASGTNGYSNGRWYDRNGNSYTSRSSSNRSFGSRGTVNNNPYRNNSNNSFGARSTGSYSPSSSGGFGTRSSGGGGSFGGGGFGGNRPSGGGGGRFGGRR